MRFEITPVVKNLLILNGVMFVALFGGAAFGVDLNRILGLYYFDSPGFQPMQIVTHMFMHGGIAHIFFNMFALWMFGSALEKYMGAPRFLQFYLVTGLGAAALHMGVYMLEVYNIAGLVNPGWESIQSSEVLKRIYSTPTVGASGAVFGLLAGFAMLFPNVPLMLIFFPIPIKAKYFVLALGAYELWAGFYREDNIAHFAHLGGALFGFLMIKYWQSTSRG